MGKQVVPLLIHLWHLGLGSNASGRFSIVMGEQSNAAAEHSIATGYFSKVQKRLYAISQRLIPGRQRATIALGYTAKPLSKMQ